MTNDDSLIALKELDEHFKEKYPPNSYPVIGWAITEIERLRKLVQDLLPFMEEDVRLALEVVPPPYDGHDSDDCIDCRWYERALVWQERIDAGEFNG